MGNKTFVYLSFHKDTNSEMDFFEVILDGKARLLIRHIAEIIPSNYNVALSEGRKKDRIVMKETYYLQKDKEEPVFIDKKGKSIQLAFSDKTKEVSEFIKKEKIVFKEKDSLVSLIKYYNSIN